MDRRNRSVNASAVGIGPAWHITSVESLMALATPQTAPEGSPLALTKSLSDWIYPVRKKPENMDLSMGAQKPFSWLYPPQKPIVVPIHAYNIERNSVNGITGNVWSR